MSSVNDNFYIKVNGNDYYSATGSYKNIRKIHTHNDVLFPRISASRTIFNRKQHTFLKDIGSDVNAYNNLYSEDTNSFKVNGFAYIPNDNLSDAISPLLTDKLFKSGVNYPIMHSYMVATLDNWPNTSHSATTITSGTDVTLSFNRYGCTTNPTWGNSGIIQLQGGGGGSGGNNTKGADCAGGGGGGGAFVAIYYRFKNNPNDNYSIIYSVGSGGSAGKGASSNGGSGGTSKVKFSFPSDGIYNAVEIFAYGGGGGWTDTAGNWVYAPGGKGGDISYTKYKIDGSSESANYVYNNAKQNGDPDQGWSDTVASGVTKSDIIDIINNNYLVVKIICGASGGYGGRGDDTAGSGKGLGGGSVGAITCIYPTIGSSDGEKKTFGNKSGGSKGQDYDDAIAGGGGASVSANGAGSNSDLNPHSGLNGSGASGCGATGGDRDGASGGAGYIAYCH